MKNFDDLLKKKILVIDDDEAILEVIKAVLEGEAYNVETSSEGSYVFTLRKKELPDLILLDMLLSGEDGKDICKKLKSQGYTHHIPVIILSAHAHIEQDAKDCGADNYLPKPFDIDVLLAVVRKHLGKDK